MKKIFFLFVMLASVAASAQSHINIEMLSATYTASPAVKFRVSWSSVPTVTGETHNAKVWVWIDFLKINTDNTTTGNIWTRAEISATPAVGSSPASTATIDASTNKGFWLNGVTGSYSATITATLTNIPANAKFNWCAYTSDCPPNVTAANGTYTFKGTPPFTLIASNGATQPVSGTTLAASALTITPTIIRDKTECPGVFCTYTGSDLLIDATHLCQQRTSGAQNWEAYIKDSRDNQIYRIVQFSDNSWWMAEDMMYAGKIIGQCSGVYFYSGNDKPECPSGWQYPTLSEVLNRYPGTSDEYGGDLVWLQVYLTGCVSGNRMDFLIRNCRNTYCIWPGNAAHWNNAGDTSMVHGCNTLTTNGRARCLRYL